MDHSSNTFLPFTPQDLLNVLGILRSQGDRIERDYDKIKENTRALNDMEYRLRRIEDRLDNIQLEAFLKSREEPK